MYRAGAFFGLFALVQASPFPQAVTSAISPTASAHSGCSASFSGMFGIAVLTLATSGPEVESPASVSPRTLSASVPAPIASAGRPQSTMLALSQIGDGQIQAFTSVDPVAQISDGQIRHQSIQSQAAKTLAPIVEISDGQIQHQTSQPQRKSTRRTKTMQLVTQIGDGQIQATPSPATHLSNVVSADPARQLSDGQPQILGPATLFTSVHPSTSSDVVSNSRPIQSSDDSKSGLGTTAVSCKSQSTLEMTLKDGLLLDNQGRTGYIANNFQFQFDEPAQAGAIYTAGWSVCSNESLALGDSSVFWQCLSGDFYNLYDRNFGARQCTPIVLQTVQLQAC